jgi:addiction module HigA family antidote
MSEGFLQPAGITQTAFSEQLSWIRAHLNEFIKGKRGITAESALDLAELLGTSPKSWMNLQATWDLDQAMKRRVVAWRGFIQGNRCESRLDPPTQKSAYCPLCMNPCNGSLHILIH